MAKYTGFEIAVIGLAGRFPKANNVKEFWNNLENGIDCISKFSNEEALNEGESVISLKDPLYIRSNAFMKDKEYFDADFFHYRPDEAELMEPQIRIFHECCWEALEDSGYTPNSSKDKIGLFATGAPNINWELYSMFRNREELVDEMTASNLRKIGFMCSRISYNLNLTGPAVFIQTACSSSLVAIHEACNSLLWGECTMALAGGIALANFSKKGYKYNEGLIFSKDGKCKPFDISSSGTVSGEGAGVVVLKKLKDAIRDRDNIYSIVKGTGINNDGSHKVGYTAPSVEGQSEVIRRVHKMAGVASESISYIEAHGTATELGDPVEVEALNDAFGNSKVKYCAIGSVKSNIGHLDTAAGVAGFIKTVLSIKNKKIPASLHFTDPNPKINFKNGPFYVNASLKNWDISFGPRRAGVSSFGIGGTNAHAVLEEAPVIEPSSLSRDFQLLVLSSKTADGLERNTNRFVAYLKENNHLPIPDVAYTLQKGRTRFKYRKMLVCESKEEAIKIFSAGQAAQHESATMQEDLRNIVFMFSGQGSQYHGMCRDLYRNEKVFRDKVNECLAFASNFTPVDYYSILFDEQIKEGDPVINKTQYAQPLLFIIEYSLACLVMEWGIKPDYMIGHSIGEYVAACISGVFSLKDAIYLVIRRGELMGQAEEGNMLNINIGTEALESMLAEYPGIDLAVKNSPMSQVVSGGKADIDVFFEHALKKDYAAKKLHTSHAFHSYTMDKILERFELEFINVEINQPKIPYISNLTGERVSYAEIKEPTYWSKHLRHTVQFSKGVDFLLSNGSAVFIELGPGRSLCNYVSESQLKTNEHYVVNTVRHFQQKVNDSKYLIEKLGRLWLYGINISWDNYYKDEQRNRVSLPTYSFEKVPYTTNIDAFGFISKELNGNFALLKNGDINYIHAPYWKRSPLPNAASELNESQSQFLVVSDRHGFSKALIEWLISCGQKVIEVKIADSFKKINNDVFEAGISEFDKLWSQLFDSGTRISNIIYCAALSEYDGGSNHEAVEHTLTQGYLGLSFLAKSIASNKQVDKINLTVINNCTVNVTEEDDIDPLKATIYGPSKIMPSEIPHLHCKVIDISFPFLNDKDLKSCLPRMGNEIFFDSGDPVVAYRNENRWVQSYETFEQNDKLTSKTKIHKDGTYIIVGAFGGMGFAIANSLVFEHKANVLLVFRSSFPKREDWAEWLLRNGEQDSISVKIRQIQEMESTGCRIGLYQADVSKEEHVKNLTAFVNQEYSTVNGLIWAAGEIDYGGIIQNRTHADFIKYISSKVYGLIYFEKYFRIKSLDFIALFSSIGNVFYQHKFGQVAYNAANQFLDSYAHYLRKKNDIHAFSINWSDWFDVGMTVKSISKRTKSNDINFINAHISEGIYPKQGVEIFYKCLQNNIPVSIIYDKDLGAAVKSHRIEFEKIRNTLNAPLSRTDINSPQNKNEIGGELIKIFAQFFGNDDINLDSDFFELGGDSLKAMTLVARINKRFGTKFSIADIYKYSTLRDISKQLSSDTDNTEIKIIPRAPHKKYYEVSSAQKRMYFLQMVDKESTIYNEVQVLWVEGKLDKIKLERVFQKLIRRHESLRTSFVVEDQIIRQIISEEIVFKVEYFKYEQGKVDEIIQSFVRPFNLSNTHLFRVGLIEKDAGENLMMIDIHHIITDLVSGNILKGDFIKLYNDEELPALQTQYKDYAEWQQAEIQQPEMVKQKDFWLNEFLSEPVVLELPTDFARPAVKNYSGGLVNFHLSSEETEQLKSIAETQGASLFMVILSVFNVLLAKLGNQEDIVVGTPIAGRHHSDLENIIGMFVNNLALRNNVDGNLTFRKFLDAVKAKSLACFDNQSYPYEELAKELKLERSTHRNPLFDVLFNFRNAENFLLAPSTLTFREYNLDHLKSKFDLSLWATDLSNQLHFNFEYSAEIFKRETIERFASYFKIIVGKVIENIDIKIFDIEILPEKEKLQLQAYNDTSSADFNSETVISLFKIQVQKAPSNVALHYNKVTISYKELDERSDAMAFHLKEKMHVEVGDLVGVLLDRDDHLVSAILGILKAGAAYVPIDPQYPNERINSIISDSKIKGLITRKKHISSSVNYDGSILELDAPFYFSHDEPVKLNCIVSPHNLAYVIYTSGSTGKPKGVVIEHKSLANYITWAADYYVKDEKASFPLFTSISFDLTVTSIFTPLITGNKIRIYEEDRNDFLIERIFKDNDVDVIKLTPSHLKILRDSLSIRSLGGTKKLIVGGEDLKSELANDIHNKFRDQVIIYNEYGPTEATVGCMIHKFDPETNYTSSVPIGFPIRNTKIYILDKLLKLVPVGVQGELYISGDGLARGYFSREALTNQSFINNPFSECTKMYKTGDVATRLPNGAILFKDRVDNQVKIRGFRIELQEIESQLNAYKDIKESVVIARERQGDKYLIAYYVSERELADDDLRSYLSNKLPSYMTPSYFVKIDKIPMSLNGKLDTKALRDPELKHRDESLKPSNEIEEKLATIWAEIIKIDKSKIDINSNFFSLGGHSLTTYSMLNRIEKEFNVKINLMAFFEKPTIKELYKRILVSRISNNKMVGSLSKVTI